MHILWILVILYASVCHSSSFLCGNWSYLHAAPALEFLSCSASCWLRALHDPKKEAQSCWECLKQLATTPSLLCICGFHNGYLGVQWKTTPKEDRLEMFGRCTEMVWLRITYLAYLCRRHPQAAILVVAMERRSNHTGVQVLGFKATWATWVASRCLGNKFFPSVFSETQGKLGLFEMSHQHIQGLYYTYSNLYSNV